MIWTSTSQIPYMMKQNITNLRNSCRSISIALAELNNASGELGQIPDSK